jgi:hypothetical protein
MAMTEDCTCGGTTLPDTHAISCPCSLYQAGIQLERARIVAWLRSYDDVHRRSALADRIEKCEHLSWLLRLRARIQETP